MPKTQTLQTYIRINATTGGFAGVRGDLLQLGDTLLELGAYANQVSQELINFGKESVNTYKDYEKSLKEAEVALATSYGQGSAQLAKVMQQLDEQASHWAETTIFHTDDVANAIAEAARSGWDFDKIMAGIPAAMELAQAGSMDLSQSVDMIVKIANAAGIQFEDIGGFIDHWAYAANSSATNIEEMGEAMMRMGGTMRFAENTDEMLTLIASMANMGYTGSEAGTLVRNTLLRMIAPTDKASDAMALLGASAEEVEAALGDEKVAESLAQLEEVGFSAFDDAGKLKPTLQIFEDLGVALADIAGGYDNIEKDKTATSILSAIFPTRTITGAINMLKSAANGWDGLYESMQGGAAEGYGSYASETMMDTLYGNIEIFYSKLENLRKNVGEALSDDVSGVMGTIGGWIDNINNLDEGTFNALVDGLEVIALAGPGLMIAGIGMRALALLATPLGGLAVGALGVTALAQSLKALHEADIESNFGEGSVDRQVIESYATMVQTEYSSALEQVNAFNTAVGESVTKYKEASTELSGQLLTAMLSKKELTEADIANLTALGEKAHTAVIDAIKNSNAASMSYWDILFGTPSGEDVTSEYADIMTVSNGAFDEAMENAVAIGEKVTQSLTEAFADGITPEEYNTILAYMREYNDAIAEAQAQAEAENSAAQMSVMLHKAQTASLDSIRETGDEIRATRDAALQAEDERYWAERGRLEYRWNEIVKSGRYVDASGNVYTTPESIATQRDLALASADSKYAARRSGLAGSADEILMAMWQTAFTQSDFGWAYSALKNTEAQGAYKGWGVSEAAQHLKTSYGDTGALEDFQEVFPNMVEDLGGVEAVVARSKEYAEAGNIEMANQLASIANMAEILSYATGGGNVLGTTNNAAIAADRGGTVDIAEMPVPDEENPLIAHVDADTGEAQLKIDALNNQQLMENVDGDTAWLQSKIDAQDGRTIDVFVNYRQGMGSPWVTQKYAEGGRATSASIFGEAGPEWAIPEEHSTRTAELIDAARAASGFTWPDLLAHLGGMNVGGGSRGTVIYSPTINANDVTGVKQALDADKARFEKWFAEREARNAQEVYA